VWNFTAILPIIIDRDSIQVQMDRGETVSSLEINSAVNAASAPSVRQQRDQSGLAPLALPPLSLKTTC